MIRHNTISVVTAPSTATTSGTLTGRFADRPMTTRPTIASAATAVMKIRMSVVLNACQASALVSTPSRSASADWAPVSLTPCQFRNMSMSSRTAATPAICSPLLSRFTSTRSPPSGNRVARVYARQRRDSGAGNGARRGRRVRAVGCVGALVADGDPAARGDQCKRREAEVAGHLDGHRPVVEPEVQVRLRNQDADQGDRERDDRQRGCDDRRADRNGDFRPSDEAADRDDDQREQRHEQHVERPPERRPAAAGDAAALEPVGEQQDEQRDTAGAHERLAEPDSPHTVAPLCAARRAAFTVLRSRQAIVIGPTPPGTGVIADATSETSSKATSPERPSSRRFVPTSITIAPGLTQSAFTIRARPTAAIRTSARRQTPGRSRVREWQVVTVALDFSSSCAIGLPNRFERPITTASAPSSCAPASSSRIITPSGVLGRSPSRPSARYPAERGVRPSTSL